MEKIFYKSYADFKADILDGKGLAHQHKLLVHDGVQYYQIFAQEGNLYYHTKIDAIRHTADVADFVDNYLPTSNQLQSIKAENLLDETISSIFECSHNFCDKTTWWQESIKVEDEVLSGSTTSWQAAHTHVINLVSGLVLYEDDLVESDDSLATLTPAIFQRHPVIEANWPGGSHYLAPILKKADDTVLTWVKESPAAGQWTIDFATGAVTTGDSLASPPKLSYHYANTSGYTLTVKPGKLLYIDNAEVDETNADIDSTKLYFDVIMDHPLLGNDVVATRRPYKTIQNIMSACYGVPENWTDSKGRKWEVFNWPYSKPSSNNEDGRIILNSQLNMRIKMHLKDDKPYDPVDPSKYASITTTVYAVSKNI